MLLWMDGFDQYGSTLNLLDDGAWAEVDGACYLSNNARTGTKALGFGLNSNARRTLGDTYENVGLGYAFYLANLPTANGANQLMVVENDGGGENVSIVLTTSGRVQAWSGDGQTGTLLATSGQVVVADSYQHFEGFVDCGAAGAVEVRINGVTVINVAGVNTNPSGGFAAQIEIIRQNATSGATMEVDDIYAWTATGESDDVSNNDFIGDKKVYTTFPDADTATEEWDLSGGADTFDLLNNNPPNDANYIYADEAGPRSIVEIAALPLEIVSIAAVMTMTRTWKTDAGNAKVRPFLVSAGVEEPGTEHPLSMAPTYYQDVYEVDPNTGAPWTIAALNAAQVGIERTE